MRNEREWNEGTHICVMIIVDNVFYIVFKELFVALFVRCLICLRFSLIVFHVHRCSVHECARRSFGNAKRIQYEKSLFYCDDFVRISELIKKV